jgi:hypothetical protein
MQRIITEFQIPTGDFRKARYVGAVKNRADDGTSVPVWEASQPAPDVASQSGKVDEWTDVLIDVEDPQAPETIKRLTDAVLARRKQQQLD